MSEKNRNDRGLGAGKFDYFFITNLLLSRY